MKFFALSILFCAFAQSHADSKKVQDPLHGLHIVSGCLVFDSNGQFLRSFPGLFCLFEDDGHFVSGDTKRLKYFDKDMKKIWSREMEVHHQLNFTLDRKQILVLSSVYERFLDKNTRQDRLLKIDKQTGETKSEFAFDELKNRLKDDPEFAAKAMQGFIQDGKTQEQTLEFTHVNSFREIPPNVLAKEYPQFSPGNLIANTSYAENRVIVLPPDLSKIIWSYEYRDKTRGDIHDVDVDEDGNLQIFCNRLRGVKKEQTRAVVKNPITDKVVWSYRGEKGEDFFSSKAGGLQKIRPGLYLIFPMTERPQVRLIDGKGKLIKTIYLEVPQPFRGLSNAKALDLSSFLKLNHGP